MLSGMAQVAVGAPPRELRAVKLEEVVEIARTFLPPDRYGLAIAGPPLPERD